MRCFGVAHSRAAVCRPGGRRITHAEGHARFVGHCDESSLAWRCAPHITHSEWHEKAEGSSRVHSTEGGPTLLWEKAESGLRLFFLCRFSLFCQTSLPPTCRASFAWWRRTRLATPRLHSCARRFSVPRKLPRVRGVVATDACFGHDHALHRRVHEFTTNTAREVFRRLPLQMHIRRHWTERWQLIDAMVARPGA